LDWAESSWTRWIQIPLLSWVTPILSLGNKRTLVQNDLNDLSVKDKCSVLLKRVDEHSSKWQSTWHLFKQTFFKDFLISILLVFPLVMVHIFQPWLIRRIVLYIKDQSGLPGYAGYLFAIGLCISSIFQSIINQQIFFLNARIGMRVRNTLSSIIYKHLLTINTAALHKTTAAQTINLISNDAGKFEELSFFVHAFVLVPLEAAGAFAFIWWNIGLPTLFGYAVLTLLVPIQFIFSRKFGQYRRSTMACTDKRVQTINELVNGCEIIKMYNWEKAMEQQVRETRRRELLNISKASCLRALNTAVSFTALPLISLATFGGSWLMGRTLLPEDVFSTLALFALIRVPLTITMPQAIEKFSQACVSARRIDQFMQLDRLANKREKMKNETGDCAIIMEDASFSWKDTPSLFSLNLKIRNGNLVGVKGAIGVGKSTFLAAILGEINLISGKLRLYVSSISYAPQSSWIFPDTIRANILLGKPMDEERYKSVIKACCLDIDLQNFGEVGDLLMIGDKGVNLSGGQKARISLARALYTDSDLYLLDDPLAAVDQKVAKDIFDQCIGPRGLLRGKTRILVTHQTHFLVESDQLILLKNGHIEEIHMRQLIATEPSNDTSETNSADSKKIDWIPSSTITDRNSIIKDEKSDDGAIKWNVWLQLFTSPPLRWFGFVLMVILMLVNEALYDFTNSWLALWSGKHENEQRSSFYVNVYLGTVFATLIITFIRVGAIFYIMLHGSTYFHNRMLNSILYTSLRFFESNPSGRILNRASKDQQVLDEALPLALIDTMQCLLLTFGSIVIVGRANPWVLLILIPLVPTILWLRRFYVRSSRQLKRLESVTRSPVYTLFSSSLDGLTSIRAFDVQADFLNKFIQRVDTNSQAYFLLLSTARWFGLRLDFVISLFILVTATLVVSLRHQIDPSIAALSISYCITLTGLFQWAIRQSTEAENFMTSAERIHEYGQLVPESHRNDNETDNIIQTANDWPSRGVIQFKDYTCRYRPELDPVLKNLNLRIESKEKIGVIGRTGIITSFMRIYMKNISKQCTVFLFCTCSSNYRKQDGIYPSRVFVKYFTKHRIGSI
jgi:ABC-type multidrug transport system fused ATPase/permease subunit